MSNVASIAVPASATNLMPALNSISCSTFALCQTPTYSFITNDKNSCVDICDGDVSDDTCDGYECTSVYLSEYCILKPSDTVLEFDDITDPFSIPDRQPDCAVRFATNVIEKFDFGCLSKVCPSFDPNITPLRNMTIEECTSYSYCLDESYPGGLSLKDDSGCDLVNGRSIPAFSVFEKVCPFVVFTLEKSTAYFCQLI